MANPLFGNTPAEADHTGCIVARQKGTGITTFVHTEGQHYFWDCAGPTIGDPFVLETTLGVAFANTLDTDNGGWTGGLDSTSETAGCGIDFNDNLCLDPYKGITFEARINCSVLPTLEGEGFVGLCSDFNNEPASLTHMAGFRLDGDVSGGDDWYMRTDDGTTDTGDDDTGVDQVAGTYHVFRVEVDKDTQVVRFFIDGQEKTTSGVTYSLAGMTSGTHRLQPSIYLAKDGGAGLGTFVVDYIRVWTHQR